MAQVALLVASFAASVAAAPYTGARSLISRQAPLENCPGYTASNIQTTSNSITADLSLAGDACNTYGTDIGTLSLTVKYETDKRLHVLIQDTDENAYQVPEAVFLRPESQDTNAEGSDLEFTFEESPFTFSVKRRSSGEVLFDSSAASLVFEDQYIRLRTALPENPNLYGLGEHSDHFRLNTTDYTRTLWSRDSFGIPEGSNLYGNHPIYFEHRGESGTHGVFLLSSSGMDIKVNNTESEGQYLEYNVLGGVIDLYFLAGDSPVEVSRQYAEVAGLPAMNSYWSLGFHTCRYGYRDFYAVAETITNYSAVGIPLETQWTDIDYMYERWIFTTDPDRYSIPRMRDIVDFLHEHDQHYIVMVDPAVAYNDYGNYSTLSRGVDQEIFLKYDNGTLFQGVVWPGPTLFPDWFHPNAQDYWNNEFVEFFDADTGVDIDGLWIDMNEAANFCPFPCLDPVGYSEKNRFPPQRPFLRSQVRPIPGFGPEFQPGAQDYPPDSIPYNDPNLAPPASPGDNQKRQTDDPADGELFSAPLDTPIGLYGRNLLAPPYRIKNTNTQQDLGGLSNNTIRTDIHHYHGLADLDVHNLYGTMMSESSRVAMLARRPGLRPLVITRSTFAGAGRHVGKWLGDNLSIWDHYRTQIQGMLEFSAIYQMPMVGSDVCGFGSNTTETLCARWAMLGAFNPFYRNHNQDSALPQEFYIWPSVTEAAKKAIDIRYRLLDYFYTAMYEQTLDGTPSLNPLFFKYPKDATTFGIELQFFYGHSILVSPVTEENATDVSIYVPKDTFYDFYTYEKIEGQGDWVNLTDIGFDDIPLHIKGGSVVPFRTESGMTTTVVRTKSFDIVVATGSDGKASGSLYLDDGVSIEQKNGITHAKFTYEHGKLEISGEFDYQEEDNKISRFTFLGVESAPSTVTISKEGEYSIEDGPGCYSFDAEKGILVINAEVPLDVHTTVAWE